MTDDRLEQGSDRDAPGRLVVALGLVLVALGGLLTVRLMTGSAHSSSDPIGPPSEPAPTSRANDAPEQVLMPWARLPVGAPLTIDHAEGRTVVADGRTRLLDSGRTVLAMADSPRGPVVLDAVGEIAEVQLLSDRGGPKVLDTFTWLDTFQLSASLVVSPDGQDVAYVGGPSDATEGRLVVRDLGTGDFIASVRLPWDATLSGWTRDGIVMAFDNGYGVSMHRAMVWRPGGGAPVPRIKKAPGDTGLLLATVPRGRESAVFRVSTSCTVLVRRPNSRPIARLWLCGFYLQPPAAFSPSGRLLAGVTDQNDLAVVDVGSGRRARVDLPDGSLRVLTVGWEDESTLLVDATYTRSVLLRCRLLGGCERVEGTEVAGDTGVVLPR